MGLGERLQHAWHAFKGNNEIQPTNMNQLFSVGGTTQPKHSRTKRYKRSEIVPQIFNRIALDVSMVQFKHVVVDFETKNHTYVLDSGLHQIFNVEANMDQSSQAFIQDLVYSMFDEGHVVIVPTSSTKNPNIFASHDISTARTGRVIEWFPDSVRIELYNEFKGELDTIIMRKSSVAIIENPLYAIVNSPNSTLDRLMQKMSQLDISDSRAASGVMDIFIQFPHSVKHDIRKKEAEARVRELEEQIRSNRTNVGYLDVNEKITQLTRPVTSSLSDEVKHLKQELYNQLGLTENIFNGTASESEIRLYNTRVIDPIVTHILAECRRKFLTKTARSRGHDIVAYRDPFKVVPTEQIATIADTFIRNAVLTANEVRGIIGFPPSAQGEADQLYNPNIADVNQQPFMDEEGQNGYDPESEEEYYDEEEYE